MDVSEMIAQIKQTLGVTDEPTQLIQIRTPKRGPIRASQSFIDAIAKQSKPAPRRRKDQIPEAQRERAKLQHGLRYAVLERDGFKCCACKRSDVVLHVDHVIPIAHGGKTKMSNLQALCVDCNKSKGRKMPSRSAIKAHKNRLESIDKDSNDNIK